MTGYPFPMHEHLFNRLQYLTAFQSGHSTASIARMHKVSEHVVANQISNRRGNIDLAIADCRAEMGEQ